MARLAASLLISLALVVFSGCTIAAALPLLEGFIVRSTNQAAEKHKTDPMTIAIYAAVASIFGAGGAGYIGVRNGKKKSGA